MTEVEFGSNFESKCSTFPNSELLAKSPEDQVAKLAASGAQRRSLRTFQTDISAFDLLIERLC